MKTYLLDIIPKIKRYSKKLDNITVLTNNHWVVIDEELNRKIVFIFRERENQLLISDNGSIEKGKWEYLGNNSILIDKKDGSYLFKHGFIDENILALKVDGKEEFALLVNEEKFDNKLNSIDLVVSFLENNYIKEKSENRIKLPIIKNETTQIEYSNESNNKLEQVNIHLTSRESLIFYPLLDDFKENEVIVMEKSTRHISKFPLENIIDENDSSWEDRLVQKYYILKISNH